MAPTFSKFPDEILYYIFLHSCEEELIHPRPLSNPFKFPWILAGTCKRWRRICLESRYLWTRINIAWHSCGNETAWVRYLAPAKLPSLMQTRLLLERSKDAHLTVHIGRLCLCDSQVAHYRELVAQSSRWKEVYVTCHPDDEADLAELLSDHTGFGNLERVFFERIPAERTWIHDMDSPLPKKYNTALPSVSSLELAGLGKRDFHNLRHLPWHQLKHLTLGRYERDAETSILSILRSCGEKLAYLDLSLDGGNDGDAYMDDITSENDCVVLPNLSTLKLGRCIVFLPFLRLPSLRSIAIDHLSRQHSDLYEDAEAAAEDGEESSYEILTKYIHQSSSPLVEFEVSDYCDDMMDFMSLLRIMPDLRTLSFGSQGNNDEYNRLIAMLHKKPEAAVAWACPSLRKLVLLGSATQSRLKPDLLVGLVDSRINSEVPLKSLWLSMDIVPARNVVLGVDVLQELEKLRVSLRSDLHRLSGFDLRFISRAFLQDGAKRFL